MGGNENQQFLVFSQMSDLEPETKAREWGELGTLRGWGRCKESAGGQSLCDTNCGRDSWHFVGAQ